MATTAPALEPSASREIPPRRVEVHDPSQLPSSGLCTTPGGTMFSTTPGGTRIIYDRKFIMSLRHSPQSRTPPSNLPIIPGVTAPKLTTAKHPPIKEVPEKTIPIDDVHAQFDIDI
ncbi:eukaryotic translation initiation factor 4E-binding protein 1-like [Oscarella lobularis]|uniref:eukaryotic translation initiation factor 4E-binding protein 1-like n=1 Tax=Oscarella lobularis TaxID=121494 RepID=UPI003313CA54